MKKQKYNWVYGLLAFFLPITFFIIAFLFYDKFILIENWYHSVLINFGYTYNPSCLRRYCNVLYKLPMIIVTVSAMGLLLWIWVKASLRIDFFRVLFGNKKDIEQKIPEENKKGNRYFLYGIVAIFFLMIFIFIILPLLLSIIL